MSLKVWTSKELLFSTDLNASFAAILDMVVSNEDLTAFTDSALITFSTAFAFKPGSLRVFLSDGPSNDMFRQRRGLTPSVGDYVENLDGSGNGISFTFNSIIPDTDSKLVVDYQKALP
jgi:hypothetical protein